MYVNDNAAFSVMHFRLKATTNSSYSHYLGGHTHWTERQNEQSVGGSRNLQINIILHVWFMGAYDASLALALGKANSGDFGLRLIYPKSLLFAFRTV